MSTWALTTILFSFPATGRISTTFSFSVVSQPDRLYWGGAEWASVDGHFDVVRILLDVACMLAIIFDLCAGLRHAVKLRMRASSTASELPYDPTSVVLGLTSNIMALATYSLWLSLLSASVNRPPPLPTRDIRDHPEVRRLD